VCRRSVNKILDTTGDFSLPSYSSATQLAERFNQFFLTTIERIHHELYSEIADDPRLDWLRMKKMAPFCIFLMIFSKNPTKFET